MSHRPDYWRKTTWEGNEQSRLEHVVKNTTPAQRLAWLEEAIEIAHRAEALSAPLATKGSTKTDEG